MLNKAISLGKVFDFYSTKTCLGLPEWTKFSRGKVSLGDRSRVRDPVRGASASLRRHPYLSESIRIGNLIPFFGQTDF